MTSGWSQKKKKGWSQGSAPSYCWGHKFWTPYQCVCVCVPICVCAYVCVCACTYALLGHSSLVAVTSKLQHCLLKRNDYDLSRALRLTNFIPIISFDHHNKLEDIDIPSVSQFSRSVVSDSL